MSRRRATFAALAVAALVALVVGVGSWRHRRGPHAPGPGSTDGTAEILAVGLWDQAAAELGRSARALGLRLRSVPVDGLGRGSLAPDGGPPPKLALVLNATAERLAALRAELRELHDRGTRVLAVDQRDWQSALVVEGIIEVDPELARYWRFGGTENYRRMTGYLAARYLGSAASVEPPVPQLTEGLYHPDAPAPFESVAAYDAWYAKAARVPPGAPKVAYVIHGSFLLLHDTKDIDALIRAFERHGLAVYAVFADAEAALRERLLAIAPDLLMTQRHVGLGRPADGSTPIPALLGVPYLKPISALHTTVEGWRTSPEGLGSADLAGQIVAQELEGTIEPLIVSGVETAGESRTHEPIPERIERLAARAASWIALRRTPEADKRVAVVYFNADLGGESLAQGSASGMFLDGPRSLVRLLEAMRARGYAAEPPADAAALVTRMRADGRNYGPWAQADIDAMAARGQAVLVRASDYRRWFEAHLPPSLQRDVVEHYGEPPGRLMVTTLHGEPEIVLPRIEVGPHVALFPQPEKGGRQDARLVHDQRVPPSHQYIAFYLWLQEVHRPHALVHLGTHGTLELLPHRAAGLGPDDYADALLGAMPNVNPWILDNVGEATLARRRAYAVLVDHLTPPFEPVRRAAPLRALHEDVERAVSVEPGPVRETLVGRIGAAMKKNAFALDLLGPNGSLGEDGLKAVDARLHEMEEERVPRSLHVLGEAPDGARRTEMIVSILGRSFVERAGGAAAAASLVRCATSDPGAAERCAAALPDREGLLEALRSAARFDAALAKTPDEIAHTLDALDGRYVPPGPGNDPVRNPAALPTGRNLFALDPEQVPSDAAMVVARKLVSEMLEGHRRKHGVWPRKIAVNLNGFETMRDTGVTEAQALVLVGAEPVRDERGVVSDVKLLAPEALGRPRVDVVLAISGTYRDDFPSRIRLLDRAIKLAQASPEPDNPLAADTREAAGRLERGGMSHDEAERAARLRIFGQPPGQYGTQLLYLLPRSGEWKDRAEMAEVYRENMRYAYGEDVWGVQADAPYAAALTGTDAVAHVWSSTMMSPLTNHHVYEYLGGLSMAVEQATGKRPDALVADARDASRSRVRDLAEVVSTEGALRLLNDGWVDEMKKSGYAGAGHVAAYTENLFGWATTVPSSVDAAVFERIERMYLEDEGKHGTRAWFEASSPESLLAVTVTLLESARRDYWKPTAEQRQRLAADYMGQVAKNGPPTGMMGGDNRALEALVREAYEAPGSTVPKAAIDAYEARLKSARAAANAAGTTLAAGLRAGAEGAPAKGARPVEVEGLAMRRAPSASTATPARGSARAVAAAAVALVVAAFAAGLARGRPRRRAARLDASDRERPPARGDSA